MILTVTNNIEGKRIVEYKQIVFGEIITGTDILKDIGAGFRDIFGGRSKGYEKDLIEARSIALDELAKRAEEIGANAVVGIKMDYETLGPQNNMLMVTCSGSAVVVE